jgi:predicted enzyme related to lactoylglutathione lyase
MTTTINRIIIYAKNIDKMAAFYQRHFGFTVYTEEDDRIVELIPPDGGAHLLLHPASKGMKEGQSCVKLVFSVEDVEAFKARCAANGLKFGATHQADGYVFANARDPGKNPIQISSRAFRKTVTHSG